MSEPIPDGGPAFPVITPDMPVNGSPGISVRDYFAAKAMGGIISAYHRPDDICMCKELLAEAAYKVADAMLKERAGLRTTETQSPEGAGQATHL